MRVEEKCGICDVIIIGPRFCVMDTLGTYEVFDCAVHFYVLKFTGISGFMFENNKFKTYKSRRLHFTIVAHTSF